MANKRRQTEDSLSQFFGSDDGGGGSSSKAAEKPEDATGGEKGRGEERSAERAKEAASAATERQTDVKRKATYYLSEEALAELEEGWFRLRQMAGQEEKGSVSKSAIVEAALRDALRELELEEEESKVARKLLK
jgi:hypothetical protein